MSKTKTKTKTKTKAEMRVAIAKDAIKQLQNERVTAGHCYGTSLSATPPRSVEEAQDDCRVCALGQLMISHVRLNNRFDPARLRRLNRETIETHLRRYFSDRQMDLIEQTYEDYDCNAPEWLMEIKNAADRMLAIFQNIVDHGGTLKPHVAYEVS